MTQILVTGAAGFIGFHLSKKLIKEGYEVIGIDNENNYYPVSLKKDRVKSLKKINGSFHYLKMDLTDQSSLSRLFSDYTFETIYHLAAQAGVRYSIDHPDNYIQSNLVGFYNMIEQVRHHDSLAHFIFASSSSVYGANKKVPYEVSDQTDRPISLYAATKKSSEMLGYSYSYLYNIPMTGLRFFTVYGPWGRPDMAYFKFTDRILKGKEIEIYNNGDMYRDFTYIDDIIEALYRLLPYIPNQATQLKSGQSDPKIGLAPYSLYNIGHNSPINLLDFVAILEDQLGIEAKKIFKPMQSGDVYRTWADCTNLYNKINYSPNTGLKIGIRKFIEWYNKYYCQT